MNLNLNSILLILFAFYSFSYESLVAQAKESDTIPVDQIELVKSILKIADKSKNYSPIDSILSLNQVKYSLLKSQLYSSKADILEYQLKKQRKQKKLSKEEIRLKADEIIAIYDTIISICDECCSIAMINKGLTYQHYRGIYQEKAFHEIKILKNFGFEEEKNGIGLGAHLLLGKNTWLGLDLSILSFLQLSYRFAKEEDDYYSHFQKSRAMEAITFSASKNVNKNIFEYSFSPMHLCAPLYLNPAKFGIQHSLDSKKGYFFYRPEIGFGWDYFFIGYSYNFMANRPFNYVTEKNLFFFKVNMTINLKNN